MGSEVAESLENGTLAKDSDSMRRGSLQSLNSVEHLQGVMWQFGRSYIAVFPMYVSHTSDTTRWKLTSIERIQCGTPEIENKDRADVSIKQQHIQRLK